MIRRECARSVQSNDVVSVAGFVQPGTHVDVLATGNEATGNERQTMTVLENVLVLAVGKSLDRNASAEAQTAPVITLAVSRTMRRSWRWYRRKDGFSCRYAIRSIQNWAASARPEPVLSIQGKSQLSPNPSPGSTKRRSETPPSAPSTYAVEMIRGSKREEKKFDETQQ